LVRRSRAWSGAFQSATPTDSLWRSFVTGSTGYLGSYLAAGLLTEHRDKLNLLIRAKTEQEARERLDFSAAAFPSSRIRRIPETAVRIFRVIDRERFVSPMTNTMRWWTPRLPDSLRRIAERKSKSMPELNLRGTLEGIHSRPRANRNGLRRFRTFPLLPLREKKNEIITEDASIAGCARITIPTRAPRNSRAHGVSASARRAKTIFRPPSFWATAAGRRTSQSIWFQRSCFWRRCCSFAASSR